MPKVTVGDIRMYYEIHGQGKPLVLIVGLGADISEYAPTIKSLARRYKVIAVDNRGAGRSDKPDYPYSIEMMADDISGLMTELAIPRAHVLGHSMGGQIALQLALRHPKQVSKLIVVSSSATGIENWVISCFGNMRRIPLLSSKYPQSHSAFILQYDAVKRGNCLELVGHLHLPVLLLHGRRDKVVSYPASQVMNVAIPGSILQSFKGGHLFFFFKPERELFVDTVTEFFG